MSDITNKFQLNTVDDLASLIHEIGFIPLFSNAIKGFSVEELTNEIMWWTGDPDTDPWEWRKILAADQSFAYGKFFGRNAGFIDKAFFPVFANYRRNGYDYDALYEDGLASHRSKKIMDAFRLDEEACGSELMTPEIKTKAGFAKENGEKNFEGAITDLQMQTYLIIGDFRRRTNRFGEEYGWAIAVLETPETKWGYKFIASGYKEDPSVSWERISGKVKKICPDAADANIRKIFGIRYPGEPVVSASSKPKKPSKPKKLRPQQLPWPENLIAEIGFEKVFGTDSYIPLNEDQMSGLDHALGMLKDREKTAVLLRYKEHKTYREIGDQFAVTGNRVREITRRGVVKLRHPGRVVYYRDGYQGVLRAREENKLKTREAIDKYGLMEILSKINVVECGLSVKSFNCLTQAGLNTLGDIVERMNHNPWDIVRIRNLGIKSLYEVITKLEEYGVDCVPVREEAILFYGENNSITKSPSR